MENYTNVEFSDMQFNYIIMEKDGKLRIVY